VRDASVSGVGAQSYRMISHSSIVYSDMAFFLFDTLSQARRYLGSKAFALGLGQSAIHCRNILRYGHVRSPRHAQSASFPVETLRHSVDSVMKDTHRLRASTWKEI
jgi:hypothetical protein